MTIRTNLNTLGIPSPLPSRRNKIWATGIASIWCGQYLGWNDVIVVVDCCGSQLLGWRLSSSGDTDAAEAAFEDSLAMYFRKQAETSKGLTIESDCSLVFNSLRYSEALNRQGITHHVKKPHQNSLIGGYLKSLTHSLSEMLRQLEPCTSLAEVKRNISPLMRLASQTKHRDLVA